MKLPFFSQKRCVQVCQVKTLAWSWRGNHPSLVSLYGSFLFKFKRNGRFGACRAQLGLGVLRMGTDSHVTFSSGFAAGVKKWEPEQNENKTGTCESSLWAFLRITWRSTLCP